MKDLLNGMVRFEGVKGVGTIQVNFVPNQRVYTFIGANGVGKTKLLECLFTVLFLSHETIQATHFQIEKREFLFQRLVLLNTNIDWSMYRISEKSFDIVPYLQVNQSRLFERIKHQLPLVYISAQNRGKIDNFINGIEKIGNYQQRSEQYIQNLLSVFSQPENFKSLNMDTNIKEWIIQRAQSANPYQAKEDNRKIELDTLLSVLNQIDKRIDSEFLEISGDNRVFIKVENQKRELAKLSSGFTSILKMIQSIIAGYSYFTNEQQIAHVRGVVLIDEIESHLHNEWQVKIIPLLKKLFPNTTFLITTHSSLVISQLEQGEAYRLVRDEHGIVQAKLIEHPAQTSIVDLLDIAFDVDLTVERSKWRGNREEAKAKFMALLERDDDIWEQEND